MNTKMELNEMQVKKLLASVGIEGAIGIVIKEIVKQDPDQVILLAEFKAGDPETKKLAYVNYKQGYPTTDQVFDSIYGIGRGSDLRIIIFNNRSGYDGNNPTADEWVVRSAIDALNDYAANLMLVKTNDSSSDFERLNYLCNGLYRVFLGYPFTDTPSAEEFRAEEFWSVYFDSLNESFYEPCKTFHNGFQMKIEWGHMLYLDPIGRIQVYWRDDGIKYVIKKDHDNYDYLEKVLCAARSEIFSRYGKENVSFKYDKGLLELMIHYSVVPFSWMMNAAPSEKMAFAEKLHDNVFSLQFRLQELFDEMDDMFEEVTEAVTL